MSNFTTKPGSHDRRPRILGVISCGAAVAIVATSVLTAQAAQASIITIGGTGVSTPTGLGSVGTILSPIVTPLVTPIATPTIAPIVTPILTGVGSTGGSTSGSLLGLGTGSTTGSLLGVGTGANGGVAVQVGNGLATVTLGGTAPNGGTATVTVGTPTPALTSTITDPTSTPTTTTPTTPATPTTTTPSDPGAPAVVPNLMRLHLDRSFVVVYPKKDGYRDSIKVLIDGVTNTGKVAAVTGKATITKGKKVVKTFNLTRSTQTVVWNGRVGKALKTGKYLLTVVEKAAGGTVTKATTGLEVSAKSLQKRTIKLSTSLTATTVHNAMPAAVRRGYALGKVYVNVTTIVDRIAPSARGKARLIFINGKVRSFTPILIGTYTSPKLTVPNTKAFRMVTFQHGWKKGTVGLRAIRVDWSYLVLK